MRSIWAALFLLLAMHCPIAFAETINPASATGGCKAGDRPLGPNLCLTRPPTVKKQGWSCKAGEATGTDDLTQFLESTGRGAEHTCYVPLYTQPCPAGYSDAHFYCYRLADMMEVPEPVDCLPGEMRDRFGCRYDHVAAARAGCVPGETTSQGMCFHYATERVVAESSGCQGGERVLPDGSCLRRNGEYYTPPSQQVSRYDCGLHDFHMGHEGMVCAYRPTGGGR
jgi:hypothetical protein